MKTHTLFLAEDVLLGPDIHVAYMYVLRLAYVLKRHPS